MAQKKPMNNAKSVPPAAPAAKPAAKPAASTEVRNTAVPPRSAAPTAGKKEPSWDQIAQRAYFNWQKNGGSEMENWLQAERELRTK
ncbi:MAG TPA: DUF2934 domain-containing protein [Tepidisphaeraceae bacterium]|jgi:hypothetical protein